MKQILMSIIATLVLSLVSIASFAETSQKAACIKHEFQLESIERLKSNLAYNSKIINEREENIARMKRALNVLSSMQHEELEKNGLTLAYKLVRGNGKAISKSKVSYLQFENAETRIRNQVTTAQIADAHTRLEQYAKEARKAGCFKK